jgi:hypothetical protein
MPIEVAQRNQATPATITQLNSRASVLVDDDGKQAAITAEGWLQLLTVSEATWCSR